MSESRSAALETGYLPGEISFREYGPPDSQKFLDIMSSTWPKLTLSIHKCSVDWYEAAATLKEVAVVSDRVVGIFFGRIDGDETSLSRLRMTLRKTAVLLKLLFGLYGRLPNRFVHIKQAIVSDRKIAESCSEADGEVTFFAVDESYRRKGIGKALMDRFVDYAKNKGVKRLAVYTTDPGSDWPFYERYGFRRCGSFKDDFMSFACGEDVSALIYVLDISEQTRLTKDVHDGSSTRKRQ